MIWVAEAPCLHAPKLRVGVAMGGEGLETASTLRASCMHTPQGLSFSSTTGSATQSQGSGQCQHTTKEEQEEETEASAGLALCRVAQLRGGYLGSKLAFDHPWTLSSPWNPHIWPLMGHQLLRL